MIMVINPTKIKSMTIAATQKHQLSPLPLDLILRGSKTDLMSEDRLSGMTLRNVCVCHWHSHTDNACKTVSSRAFLLPKLRYTVDIDTRKLFFKAHIKPHIEYASVVWEGCSDVLEKALNSLHSRAVKLIFPNTTLTTDQKLKRLIRIMRLYTNNCNTTRVCSCSGSLTMRPGPRVYKYPTCTHNNNNVHLSCAHQRPERSHDTY